MSEIKDRMINLAPGKYLFLQGTPADCAYNLMQGKVSLWKDGNRVSVLSSNNIIGWEGVYSSTGVYPYSVYVENQSRFYIFPQEKLPEMLLDNAKLGLQAYRSLGKQLNNLWEFISHPGQKSEVPHFLGKIENFHPGDYVIKEGEYTDQIYRIISTDLGLEVSKQGESINTLTEPGDFFGEMAAVLQEPRTASVRSLGESVLEIYPSQLLYNILSDYPELSYRLISNISRRLEDMNQYILNNP